MTNALTTNEERMRPGMLADENGTLSTRAAGSPALSSFAEAADEDEL